MKKMFCIRTVCKEMLTAQYKIIISLYESSKQLYRIHEFTMNSISIIVTTAEWHATGF